MKILEVSKMSFSYGKSSKKTLNNISFSAEEGELIFICGGTASGKTTLLKCLKPEITPYGELDGEILFMEKPIKSISEKESVSMIGYVMQRPEGQIVTHRVKSELAFCGENLGLPQQIIKRQVAETAAYFGFENILELDTSELSGGTLQLLNLASVLAVNPKLIILDEPTAQLDPISAGNFIRTLSRITKELGVTIIIVEHRFEELLPVADKILFIENGCSKAYGTVIDVLPYILKSTELFQSLPAWLKLYEKEFSDIAKAPVNLSEGRRNIEDNIDIRQRELSREMNLQSGKTAIEIKNVFFTYSPNNKDVLQDISLSVNEGEIFSVMGSNGSGKSTLFSVLLGENTSYRGSIKLFGQKAKKRVISGLIAQLPQDVHTAFFCDTVGDELKNTDSTDIYDFRQYYEVHPYDLSGGQQQLLAIKKILMKKPKILLLDEPTKGLDGKQRKAIIDVIKKLKSDGITILIVTHDMEFAAECSDRCGLLFDGNIIGADVPQKFFSGNLYYTTSAAKTADGFFNEICTADELTEICHLNLTLQQ